MRHGEAESNLDARIIWGRSFNVKLTERGKKQIRALGYRLNKEKVIFDEIHSSPILRCRQSVDELLQTIDSPSNSVGYNYNLVERSQGEWEGRLRAEIYTPEMLDEINNKNPNFCPPNGESQNDCVIRFNRWIKRFTDNYSEDDIKNIGIMGHRNLTQCFYTYVTKGDPKATFLVPVDNASIYLFSYINNEWRSIIKNDIRHLENIGTAPSRWV